MILGNGVDIVDTSRIKRSVERFGTRFARRILSSREMQRFETTPAAAAYLARQFAAKEAVSKALGTGMRGVHFSEIEVLRQKSGAPYVELQGGALSRAEALGVLFHAGG